MMQRYVGTYGASVLQTIGAVAVAIGAVRAAGAALKLIVPRRSAASIGSQLYKKYSNAGKWAVVTGGSDGIGRELAIQLAVHGGFNVCVIARTQSKLDEVVETIAKKSNGAVTGLAIAFDFSTSDLEAYKTLTAQLAALEGGIGILVNNVGMSHTNGELYEEPSLAEELRLLHVNCLPSLALTKFIIPLWKASGKKGAVVNLSSLSAVVRAVPYLATYGATKAFNRVFSNSLTFELKPFGIDVLTVTPGFVSTNMTQGSARSRPRTNFQMVDVSEMAFDVLAALASGAIETAGHRNHVFVQSILESFATLKFIGTSGYKMMKGRSDFRKKKAAQQS